MDDGERFAERHRSQMLSIAIVDFDRLVQAERSSPDFALHQATGAPDGFHDSGAAVRKFCPFFVPNELAFRPYMEMESRHGLLLYKGGSALGLSAAKARSLLGDSCLIPENQSIFQQMRTLPYRKAGVSILRR